MAKTDFKNIDEYIETFPPHVQKILQTVRKIVHKAVPEAEEVISYQVPAFKYHGFIVYFAGYTNHYSIAAPPPTMELFKKELSSYQVSKSTVRFPLDEPIPEAIITKIAKFRAKENLKNKK